MTDDIFWDVYYTKSGNYSAGPAATEVNDVELTTRHMEETKRVYGLFKNKEDSIPPRTLPKSAQFDACHYCDATGRVKVKGKEYGCPHCYGDKQIRLF